MDFLEHEAEEESMSGEESMDGSGNESARPKKKKEKMKKKTRARIVDDSDEEDEEGGILLTFLSIPLHCLVSANVEVCMCMLCKKIILWLRFSKPNFLGRP